MSPLTYPSLYSDQPLPVRYQAVPSAYLQGLHPCRNNLRLLGQENRVIEFLLHDEPQVQEHNGQVVPGTLQQAIHRDIGLREFVEGASQIII